MKLALTVGVLAVLCTLAHTYKIQDRAAKNDDVQKTSNSETSLLRALISKLAGKIEEEKKDVGDAAKTDISGKGRSLSLLHGSGTTSSGKAAVVRAAQHLREMQAHAQKAGRNTGQATPSVSQSAAQTHKRTLQKLRGLLHSKPWSKTQGKKSVTDVGYDDPLEENYMEEMFERCVMTDEVGYQFLNYEDEECFDWDWAVYEVCYFQESETSPPGCDKWGDVWNDIYMANDELYIELYDSSYYGSGIGDYGYYDTSVCNHTWEDAGSFWACVRDHLSQYHADVEAFWDVNGLGDSGVPFLGPLIGEFLHELSGIMGDSPETFAEVFATIDMLLYNNVYEALLQLKEAQGDDDGHFAELESLLWYEFEGLYNLNVEIWTWLYTHGPYSVDMSMQYSNY
ncbi:uncharacterized protein LOC128212492 [Mya arenaria]|uniref:uncharacterized protein LOC128212492 n=1 Tax=Mya arenaria TaxID=6604 RepID=UPI0022E4F28C|nr:uncharacterized protein LOC128212492 [Mya arenaria]